MSPDQLSKQLDAYEAYLAKKQELESNPMYQAQQAEMAAMRDGEYQKVGLPATNLPPSGPLPSGAPLAEALPGEMAGKAANDATSARAARAGRLIPGGGTTIPLIGGSGLSIAALAGLDSLNQFLDITSGSLSESDRFFLGDRSKGELVIGSGSDLQDDIGFRSFVGNGGDA